MKTLTAILLHVGVGAVQVGLPFLTNNILPNNPLPNSAQIPIQAGLLLLQGVLANINSKSAPNGAPIIKLDARKYEVLEKK